MPAPSTKAPRSEIVAAVRITSRHGVERELRRMRRSVESLPERVRSNVIGHLCGSKAGHHYGIDVRFPESAEAIAPFLLPLRASHIAFLHRGKPVGEIKAQ